MRPVGRLGLAGQGGSESGKSVCCSHTRLVSAISDPRQLPPTHHAPKLAQLLHVEDDAGDAELQEVGEVAH